MNDAKHQTVFTFGYISYEHHLINYSEGGVFYFEAMV